MLVQPGGPTDVDVGEAQGQLSVCQATRDRLGAEVHAIKTASDVVPHPWISRPLGTVGDVAEVLGILYGNRTSLSN